MGSLGDDDDEIKPIEKNLTVDLSDSKTKTKTKTVDCQFSPSSLSGEKSKDKNTVELQFLQSTICFDDTAPLEDAFEIQAFNLGGETQLLDELDCIQNTGTQLLDDCNTEPLDSDRTEVLGDTEELSDDDSQRVGSHPVARGDVLETTLCKQDDQGLKAKSDTLNKEERSSGSVHRGFTSIRTASLRASGLAARSKGFAGTDSGSSLVMSDSQYLKQHPADDNGIAVTGDLSKLGDEFDQEHALGEVDTQKGELSNGKKYRVGSSTVRKLFTEDTVAETKWPDDNINNAFGGADLHSSFASEKLLAGLSYVDSQEPGEPSQANALDFVDRFLKFNVLEFGQEVDFGKSTGGKTKPVSSARGAQSLAKQANYKSEVGERGVFDWDDSREDEGGGEFFRKKKEAFFDNGGQRQISLAHPRKPKCLDSKGSGAVEESSDVEEQLDISEKNPEGNDKLIKVSESRFGKNLIKELDQQLNMGSKNRKVATSSDKDTPDMLNIGVDTQMAAEAIEALCHGNCVDDHDYGNVNQGAKNMPKGSPEGKTNNRAPKQNFLHKKVCSNSGVITGKSKKTKKTGTRLSAEFSISPLKQSKHVRKQCGTGFVKAETKRARFDAKEQCFNNERAISSDGFPKIIDQRKEVRVLKRSDMGKVDRSHVTASSSSKTLVETSCLLGQLGTSTPIASRTRNCTRLNQPKRAGNAVNDSREEMNDLMILGSFKNKRKRSRNSVDASKVLNAKSKSLYLETDQSDEQNAKLIEQEQSSAKLIGKTTALEIDVLSYPRGRRTRQKSSSVASEDNEPSVARLTRSKTCAIERKTQLSVCAGPVLPSLDRQSGQRLLQQSADGGSSWDTTVNFNSVAINGNVVSTDVVRAQACKHSHEKSDTDFTSVVEGAEANARLELSPGERCKPSASACITPLGCTTPINAASPICMGDEYLKQSCRKNLRPSLMKEINSLIASGPESTSAIKHLRRRKDMANVHVLFSHHLDGDIIKQQKKILARLGASEASSISHSTHFITDKFVRTRNMLEAIAFGKPVVTHLWLESCGQASCLIDERNYILRDAKKEKEFGFSLPVSLARACQHPLLQRRRVLITPNTKPGVELLASLVKAVHGMAVERIGRSALKDEKIPDDLLVLSCEEDYAICVPFLEKGAAVYSSELLLNGIVTQKLEYERHRLFLDHVRRTRSTIWLKKDNNQCRPVAKSK